MDLGTVTDLVPAALPPDWRPGDAWLAGGTWLFSEPQEHLTRLLDLSAHDWPALEVHPDRLVIAATCTIAQLHAFEPPPEWTVGPLVRACCEAFLASFKVWNVATVGGNLANALPAGPMISLTAALGGRCELWRPDGGIRHLDAVDLVTGDSLTALAPGELIRSITLPAAALRSRTAIRRRSLTTLGRSAALLIGRLDAGAGGDGGLVLTVTASTVRPYQLRFPGVPGPGELAAVLGAAIPPGAYHDDPHGLPVWRRHLTRLLAEEIRVELDR